ncbi:hypothetical protein [Gryllotalpicola ginsengisoli]|uniref:hypothetical protein n=1 Tax=Gryllotalpicola ginsengisoli TaxID=444608 RepID=UPI0003B406C9|nr:hypothetical protein [Gryllotalpicola ginsengisoli]
MSDPTEPREPHPSHEPDPQQEPGEQEPGEQAAQAEGAAAAPEPGSPEWFLAQLTGGRITSRRERREAEAVLEAEGVEVPAELASDDTGETDASAEPAPRPDAPHASDASDASEAPESSESQRPKTRFSWDTGLVEPIAPEEPAEPIGSAEPAEPAEPTEPAGATTEGESDTAVPFMWHLAPTSDPDPFVVPAKPALPEEREAPSSPVPEEREAPTSPVPEEREARLEGSTPPVPEEREARLEGSSSPLPEEREARLEGPASDEPRDEPAVDGLLGRPLTPPAFDPFAQDLFNPHPEISTPIPSVDEFTIPDEEPVDEPASPRQDGPHITSDWSDITALFGGGSVGEDDEDDDADVDADADDADADDADADGADADVDDEDVDDEAAAAAPTVAFTPGTATPGASETPSTEKPVDAFDGALARQASPAPTAPLLSAAVPPVPPYLDRPYPNQPATRPQAEHTRTPRTNRWLLLVAVVLAAVLVAVGLYALGRAVASGGNRAPAAASTTSASARATTSSSPTRTKTASATPSATPTPSIPATGALPAGTYQWDELRGGECLQPFTTPWAQEFTVVPCQGPHAAQLVYTAPYSSDPDAAFPGESAIAAQINLLCSKPGIIDMTAAAAYNDIQLVGAYPVTEEQWNNGQRNYYCFADRSSGQPLTASIAGPGPTQ